MNIAIKIKELRESVGMTRKEFAEYTGIPIRTLEDWEAERRIPPAYVPRLLAYKLKYEKILQKNSLQSRNVNFIEDIDGLKIVLIILEPIFRMNSAIQLILKILREQMKRQRRMRYLQ